MKTTFDTIPANKDTPKFDILKLTKAMPITTTDPSSHKRQQGWWNNNRKDSEMTSSKKSTTKKAKAPAVKPAPVKPLVERPAPKTAPTFIQPATVKFQASATLDGCLIALSPAETGDIEYLGVKGDDAKRFVGRPIVRISAGDDSEDYLMADLSAFVGTLRALAERAGLTLEEL